MTKLSSNVIRRLTLYHGLLSDYVEKGVDFVSSPQLATMLRMDDSQVRKDILLCHTQGKGKVGYTVADLKLDIERFLGLKKTKKAVIVGAGNLGFALAKYADFKDYGLEIAGIFDDDEIKIGQLVNGMTVSGMQDLERIVRESEVQIAILTVPRRVAQSVAEKLIKANIHFIWNFTPTVLSVPENIDVCHENLLGNFLPFIYDK